MALTEDDLKTLDPKIAIKQKNAEDQAKKLDTTIANLEAVRRDFAKNSTKQGWADGNTSAHQRCRSM